MMRKGASRYRGYRDLKVYQLSYQLALEIQELTTTFPKEERYSLIDQIRRSSRSVPANLAEAWKKRRYEKAFISKIIDWITWGRPLQTGLTVFNKSTA